MSLASGAGNISEPRLISQFGRVRDMCAHRSVLFYSQRSGGASIGLLTYRCNHGTDIGGL